MADNWKVVGSTHGMSCAGCSHAADQAITTARVTGSVGATYDDNGNHVAKVERVQADEAPSDDPYCAKHGQRFDPAVGCSGCTSDIKRFECPYDYMGWGTPEGILAHMAEKHPRQLHLFTGLSPLLLSSRLHHIDASYNGPATD